MKLTFLALVIFFAFSTVLEAVPVMPNETAIRGRIEKYCLISSSFLKIEPEMPLCKLVVSVESVEGVKGPNFLKGKEGQLVTLYSKEKQPVELFGKKAKITLEYRGDERGGLFWIKRIEVIE